MRKAIALDPRDANALNYLGYTYADLGQNLDEAERWSGGPQYKPNDGYITDSLGWVYYQRAVREGAAI
jgi:Tfp pilus assembly protein PilF